MKQKINCFLHSISEELECLLDNSNYKNFLIIREIKEEAPNIPGVFIFKKDIESSYSHFCSFFYRFSSWKEIENFLADEDINQQGKISFEKIERNKILKQKSFKIMIEKINVPLNEVAIFKILKK